MNLTLTAVLLPAEEGGFVGYIEELPGTNTQGETVEEAMENLLDAVEMLLEINPNYTKLKKT